ncbi:MAG: TetR/AcrR family transcriptional regulator [Alphaproteobacteria bacterium]
MARPRSFTDSDVLDRAMDCFWSDGLNGTSVRDLAEVTGLQAPSLYNAFGDKRALFAAVLERYAERFMRERVARLEAMDDPKAAIIAFLDELIERSVADPDGRGCLLVNSALEVAPHDPELAVLIGRHLDDVRAFFERSLTRIAAAGLLRAEVTPADGAAHFLALVLAIRVASRMRPDRDHLTAMMRPALTLFASP